MSAAPSTAKPQRQSWIDALRGLAVLGMIWTHACNTFLLAQQQSTSFYHQLSYWHGIVAPTFLYLAGYNRGLSAQRSSTRSTRLTVRRLLGIWAIGYLLHVPWGMWLSGDFSAESQRIFFQVDVLHCLAASCLILLGIEQLGPRWAPIAAAMLLVGVIKCSYLGYSTGWLPVDGYLTREHGSLFPLLPWLGFAAWGFLAALLPATVWRRIALGAALCIGLPWLAEHYPTLGLPQAFFLERVGWVMLLCVLFQSFWHHLERGWSHWLLLSGRQSLVMYVAHLLLIHALPLWAGQTLQQALSQQCRWPTVWALFLSLSLLSLLCAWAWENRLSLKKKGTP
jgi:uncharacterized membrane protein